MIGVAVRPDLPLFTAELAEDGMAAHGRKVRQGPEAFVECDELATVGLELCRLGPLAGNLIEAFRRLDSLGPLHRQVQCNPPNQVPGHPSVGAWRRGSFAQEDSQGFREVADRLVGRHLSPMPRIFGQQGLDPASDLVQASRVAESLGGHGSQV